MKFVISKCCIILSITSVCLLILTGCSKNFPLTPASEKEVSFEANVKPLIIQYGCPSCHGGTSGLTVTSVPLLLQGGDHGPAIIPGNADSSILIQKLSSHPPFGDRMPYGGPYLVEAEVQIFKDWINQGAKDN